MSVACGSHPADLLILQWAWLILKSLIANVALEIQFFSVDTFTRTRGCKGEC